MDDTAERITLDIEGPRITGWGATSRHFIVEWDGERIEMMRGADGRWRNVGQPRKPHGKEPTSDPGEG